MLDVGSSENLKPQHLYTVPKQIALLLVTSLLQLYFRSARATPMRFPITYLQTTALAALSDSVIRLSQ
jgi:hypothetical protein